MTKTRHPVKKWQQESLTGIKSVDGSFFSRNTVTVARDLLGCCLFTTTDGGQTAGKIVEVEAYVGPEDAASHGFQNRRSDRNKSMFGPPGIVYVYRIYGIHWCVNISTVVDGFPAAVLIRALEPMTGHEIMRKRRGVSVDRLLCSGPGRLCQAMGITRDLDGLTVPASKISITCRETVPEISTSARIGVTRAQDLKLRFFVTGSESVSKRKARLD